MANSSKPIVGLIMAGTLLMSCLVLDTRGNRSHLSPVETKSRSLWETQKKYIAAELNSCKTDFEKVNFLREYVSAMVKVSDSDEWEINLRHDLNKLSLEEIYNLFENDRATAQCVNTSKILGKFYEQYGFRSFVYSTGKDAFGHTFNLAEIQDAGVKKLVVEDATLNFTLTDSSGSAKDALELLSELSGRQFYNFRKKESFQIGEALIENHDFLIALLNIDKNCREQILKVLPSSNPAFSCKVIYKRGLIPAMTEINADLALTDCGEMFETKILHLLEANGYSREFMNLMLIKSGELAGNESQEINARIDAIISGHNS